MTTLFDEAIADARQLRKVAEQNAKNKILESITPRIRMLIEQELIDDIEDTENDDIGMDSVMDSLEDSDIDSPTIDIDVQGDATIALSSGDITQAEDEYETDDESSYIGTEDDDLMYSTDQEDDLMSLNTESARALAMFIKNPALLGERAIDNRVNDLAIRVKRFNRLLEWANINKNDVTLRESARKHYTQLLKEAISLRDHVIFTKRAQNKNNVRSRFNEVIKEMKKMSRRHAESLFDRLFEQLDAADQADQEETLDELDVVLSDEDLETLGVEDTEEVSVDDLDVVVSMAGAEDVEEEEIDVEDEQMDLGELDLMLTDDDLDVLGVEDTDEVNVDDLDVSIELAADEDEEVVDVEEETEEEVYELDEASLRRALRHMRRLREQEEAKDADPSLDHGGEDLGDVLVDVSEEDLLNALADELGPVSETEVTVESRRRRNLRRRRAQRIAESRARTRKGRGRKAVRKTGNQLKEYKRAVVALKNQLTEMNLFNAKLLYVNKLMQNRNLSSKQQRAIVEALDNAKTLREAKLLYKSLTTSLKKRGTLREGRKLLGSSSRSTRSAASAKKSGETDRWAVLAGIDNKK